MHSKIENPEIYILVSLTLAAMFLVFPPLQLLLADREEPTGTSQPNARGTLLPPQPPEPQRGHTQPESN